LLALERALLVLTKGYRLHVASLEVTRRLAELVANVEGATDAAVFLADVEHVLAPTLRPGDIVVMDNRRAHKVAGVPQVIAGRGARLIYWPPYSPDRSPIEPCWSKLKAYLRKVQARTRETLEIAMTQALATITAADAHGWFRHGGYALQ
jgi:transposase